MQSSCRNRYTTVSVIYDWKARLLSAQQLFIISWLNFFEATQTLFSSSSTTVEMIGIFHYSSEGLAFSWTLGYMVYLWSQNSDGLKRNDILAWPCLLIFFSCDEDTIFSFFNLREIGSSYFSNKSPISQIDSTNSVFFLCVN